MRIIKEPVKVPQNKPGNHEWQFTLSDNRVVNLIGLSAIPGIKPSSMLQRLRDYHWSSKKILAAKGKPGRKRVGITMRISAGEFGSLADLSDRPRGWKLARM